MKSEIRLRKGGLDDIVLINGDVHLEDIDGRRWWLGFYQGQKRISFWISSKSKITVTVTEDELGIKKVEQDE